MAAPGITLIWSFTYRDQPEEWGNTFHFTTPFADEAEFKNVVSDLCNMMSLVLTASSSSVRAYGYDDTDEAHKYVWDMTVSPGDSVPGAFPSAGTAAAAGDQAATVRWDTGRKSSRGKSIYLRKYIHGPALEPTDPDELKSTYLTALQAFGDSLLSPTLTGAVMAGPDGQAPTGACLASKWVTTRTLKRRGKRPPP